MNSRKNKTMEATAIIAIATSSASILVLTFAYTGENTQLFGRWKIHCRVLMKWKIKTDFLTTKEQNAIL